MNSVNILRAYTEFASKKNSMNLIDQNTPALVSFIAGVNAKKESYRVANGLTVYSSCFVEVYSVGEKYIRLISGEIYANGGHKSLNGIYCFIDRATGEIYKAGSAKAPVKTKTSRGNILADDNGLDRVNHYGPIYLN